MKSPDLLSLQIAAAAFLPTNSSCRDDRLPIPLSPLLITLLPFSFGISTPWPLFHKDFFAMWGIRFMILIFSVFFVVDVVSAKKHKTGRQSRLFSAQKMGKKWTKGMPPARFHEVPL